MLIYEGGEIIKKYPFVKQRGIKDCGPACVQMILKHYNGYVSMDKLSEMMNTNQNGTTAYDIKKTLNNLGFKSYGIKTNNIENLNLPFIAHIIINSYKHYVVIYKVNLKKQTIIIADPAENIKQISFKEFDKMWSGVSIIMKPVKKIVCEPKPKIIKYLTPYLKNSLKLLINIQLLNTLEKIFLILSYYFFPIAFLFLNSKIDLFWLLLFIPVLLIKNILTFKKNKLLIKLNTALDKNLSTDIFKQLLNLPYRYYRRKTTGEITSYFNDLTIIKNTIIELAQICLIEIPLIVILIIYFIIYNKLLLFICVLEIITFLAITFHYNKKQNLWISEKIRQKANVNSFIVENITGFETIKNINIASNVFEKFKINYQKYIKSNQMLYDYGEKSELLKTSVNNIFIVIIIIIIKIKNDNIITSFIFFQILTSFFKNIFTFNYQINEISSALSNITELISKKSENLSNCISNDIVIQNLSYSYYNVSILKNINLKIPFKSKVLVTGPSGSGKSTLFKIIKGYYPDYKGSVKINNYEVNQKKFNDIVYISQKEILFTGTLEDNLNLKTKNPNAPKICEIENLSRDIILEEDGFNLSGGQKQRIILARALNHFNILIIDEGLNQVSVDMERRILKKLFKEYKDKTIIYISHRLDNLDLFEKFIKIDNGKIVINTTRNN